MAGVTHVPQEHWAPLHSNDPKRELHFLVAQNILPSAKRASSIQQS
jgi:hypothetical protein